MMLLSTSRWNSVPITHDNIINASDTSIHGISEIFRNRAASPYEKLVINDPMPFDNHIDNCIYNSDSTDTFT